jgi:uroporphyrinogen-III synthase
VIAVSQNAAADPRLSFSPLREATCQAFLSVPVVDSGEIIGAISVHHKQPHRHASDELAIVAFMGEQMGGVIARARLAERSLNAVRRMQTLAAVAQAIGARNRLERILDAISKILAQTLDAAVCSILLVDYERKELTVGAARCSAPDYMHRMPIRLGGSLLEYMIGQGHPIVIPDIHTESQYRYPELGRKSGLMSLLAVPLTSQGKVIGSINTYTRDEREFSDYEIGFLRVVAGQAAIAIRNARLMSETLDMRRKLEGRKLIERAKGILQHKHNLTEEEAYLRLRDESSRLQRSMRVLAEAVILAEDLGYT